MTSVYVGRPTIDVDFLKPARAWFDTPGGGLEGPRDGTGFGAAIDFTGGGLVTAAYEKCYAQAPEEHGYINKIAAYCNGSVRAVNVPILTDWMGPFPLVDGKPRPFVGTLKHTDGSYFTDGSGYTEAAVFGTVARAAPVHSGQIVINVYGAARYLTNLRSEWFSIQHPTKGWRAFRNWETSDPTPVTETIGPVTYNGYQYTIAIAPALREAVEAGERVELVRPRCVMRLPKGFTLRWEFEGFYRASPSMEFIEA